MNSVVRIHITDGQDHTFKGSGFLAHSQKDSRLVFATHHQVADYVERSALHTQFDYLEIHFPSKKKFDASIVRHDKDSDLALLKYYDQSVSPNPLQFFQPSDITHSGEVVTLAYFSEKATRGIPGRPGIPIHPGLSSGVIIGPPAFRGKCKILHIISDEVSEPGASGGPLLKDGKVIGIRNAGAAGVVYAITLQTIEETLRKWTKSTGSTPKISEMLEMIAAETDS